MNHISKEDVISKLTENEYLCDILPICKQNRNNTKNEMTVKPKTSSFMDRKFNRRNKSMSGTCSNIKSIRKFNNSQREEPYNTV